MAQSEDPRPTGASEGEGKGEGKAKGEAEADAPSAGPLEQLVDELRCALAEALALAASARRVAALELDRARLRAREAVFGLALLACALAVGAGMLVAAGALLVLGLAELLRSRSALPSWAGTALAGLIVAGLPIAMILLLRRVHLRRLGAELQRKYAKDRDLEEGAERTRAS